MLGQTRQPLEVSKIWRVSLWRPWPHRL